MTTVIPERWPANNFQFAFKLDAAIAFLATILVFGIDHCSAVASDLPTGDEIAEAWKIRSAELQSFDVAWLEEVTIPKGVLGRMDPRTSREDFGSVPAAPMKSEENCRVVFDRSGRFRQEETSRGLGQDGSEIVKVSSIKAYDRETRRLFYPVNQGGNPYAAIDADAKPQDFTNVRQLALRLYFLPFDARFGILQEAAIRGATVSLAGEREYRLQLGQVSVIVGDAPEFPIIAYERRENGAVKQAISITPRHVDGDLIPQSWAYVYNFAGGQWHVIANVTACSVNGVLDDEMFEIDLPDGTWVNDYRQNTRYMIQKGGVERTIHPGEFIDGNFDELMRTKPGTAGRLASQTGNARAWMITISTLLVGALLIRRFRRWMLKNEAVD